MRDQKESEFVLKYGIEVLNEVKSWNRGVDDVLIYDNIDDLNEDYNSDTGYVLQDAEDVFGEFGDRVRAVEKTGQFIIDIKELPAMQNPPPAGLTIDGFVDDEDEGFFNEDYDSVCPECEELECICK